MKLKETKLYTRKEVMEVLRIGNRAMRNLVKQKKLKPFTIGRSYRFTGSEILGFMSNDTKD